MRVLNAVEEKKVKISFRHFVYQFSHGSPFVLDDWNKKKKKKKSTNTEYTQILNGSTKNIFIIYCVLRTTPKFCQC